VQVFFCFVLFFQENDEHWIWEFGGRHYRAFLPSEGQSAFLLAQLLFFLWAQIISSQPLRVQSKEPLY